MTKIFKIHCKILNMYLEYSLKYMHFKILSITVSRPVFTARPVNTARRHMQCGVPSLTEESNISD